MFLRFADKALEDFYTRGSLRGISPTLAPRVRKCLRALENASMKTFTTVPGTHKLRRGKATGAWAVKVSGAWRIVFRTEDGTASEMALCQYH